jgi:hypothetical protein
VQPILAADRPPVHGGKDAVAGGVGYRQARALRFLAEISERKKSCGERWATSEAEFLYKRLFRDLSTRSSMRSA